MRWVDIGDSCHLVDDENEIVNSIIKDNGVFTYHQDSIGAYRGYTRKFIDLKSAKEKLILLNNPIPPKIIYKDDGVIEIKPASLYKNDTFSILSFLKKQIIKE